MPHQRPHHIQCQTRRQMQCQIRRMTPADEASVIQILKVSQVNPEFPSGSCWTEAQAREECRRGLGWVVIDDPSGQVAGFILAQDVGSAWEIEFLATAQDARRCGVMKNLLSQMILELPPGKAIWLEVHEANMPARRLYERHGFKQVGTRPEYYADGGSACLYNYG